jgi:hypothetical protein
MKSLFHPKQRRGLSGFPILLLVTCLALSRIADAVVPAPDGGYPGYNTAEGQNALFSLTTGVYNTALGAFTLFADTTGVGNTAVGINSLRSNDVGKFNTAVGLNALFANQSDDNSAFGAHALFSNTQGIVNSAFGWQALMLNTQGSGNTAAGAQSLSRNVFGNANTATGRGALSFSTGDFNTAIGYTAGINVTTASNVICVGAQVAGADVDDSCFIGNIWAQAGGPQAVYVNIDGKLGAQVSSQRFKDDIKPMDKSSRALYSLKPITFRYKKEIDPVGASQFGLVAEEVQKVNPDLVLCDKEGKPFSVRYDQVNAMLLNEFLKEHKAFLEEQHRVSEQGAIIAKQQTQIEALTAMLQEQAAQIQRVSAQVQMDMPATKMALNNFKEGVDTACDRDRSVPIIATANQEQQLP